MDNKKYKILLKEHSMQENGYPWSLQEYNKENPMKGFTPWKGYISFSLKNLHLTNSIYIDTSLDEETHKDKQEAKETSIIHGKLRLENYDNFNDVKINHKLIMFGSNCEINNFHLYISITENPDDIATCIIDGYTYDTDDPPEFGDSIVIKISLTSQQFNYISDLIKKNHLERLEIYLNEPDGFYSALDSDFIKILTNSKEHEVITPDNCSINPPRLGKTYFALTAFSLDDVTEKPEKNDLHDDKNEDIQEYKQLAENLLNRLDPMKGLLAFPLWIIITILFFILFKL